MNNTKKNRDTEKIQEKTNNIENKVARNKKQINNNKIIKIISIQ